VDNEWRQFIPDFDYIYNNLGEISDEKLEVLNNKFLVASLLTLKHSFQKDWLEFNARRILNLTEHTQENLQKNLIVYLFVNSGLEEDKILELLESFSYTLKETVMNTLEIFEKKGRDEGLELGIEKGVKIGTEKTRMEIVSNLIRISTLTDEQIASASDVTTDFVAKIRKEINIEK